MTIQTSEALVVFRQRQPDGSVDLTERMCTIIRYPDQPKPKQKRKAHRSKTGDGFVFAYEPDLRKPRRNAKR